MVARLKGLASRIHRFRQLRKVNIDASMLLRTGGKQEMTYGLGIIGVSDSMLRDMRRVAAAIAAPASGTGGQNLDAALIVADGGSPVERTQHLMLASSQLVNGQRPYGTNGFLLIRYTGW